MVMFYWDTGFLLEENLIIKKKLLFIHHLATLPDDALAKEVYKTQKRQNIPGLVRECNEHLCVLGIEGNPEDFSKRE